MQFADIRNIRPDQREQLQRSLYANTLLGNSEHVFSQSSEFAAFCQGFDLHLLPEIPSFVEVLCLSTQNNGC